MMPRTLRQVAGIVAQAEQGDLVAYCGQCDPCPGHPKPKVEHTPGIREIENNARWALETVIRAALAKDHEATQLAADLLTLAVEKRELEAKVHHLKEVMGYVISGAEHQDRWWMATELARALAE
jgi:hypothetical protein